MQSNAFQLNAFQQDGLPTGSYTLLAETGVFTLTGVAAGLRVARLLTAQTATYSLTGQSVGLLARRYLAAGTGTYTLTGQDATIRAPYRLTAETGVFTLTGRDATLTYSGAPAPVTTVQNKTGRRNYIVKGKLYRQVTNEELAYLLARDLIEVTREDVKVTFKAKKPHKISKNAWDELKDSLKLFDKFDPVPWDDDEEAAMLLL